MADLGEIVKEAVSNATQNATETVGKKTPATMEGMAVAYGSLVVMAVFPVFFGAVRSVKFHKVKLQKEKTTGQASDKMSYSDAAMFPFLASGTLLVLYTIFKVFSKEDLNRIITAYFYCLGVFALCHLLSPLIAKLIPGSIENVSYRLKFTKGTGRTRVNSIDYSFTTHDVICLVFCSLLGLWYLIQKHWIANNLFGIAFAINGVEMLLLNNMSTGCILLGGLFIYDIFWVFYTDVMVTVAKSFEAPIKLVFPQDFLENGISASNFAMLGLGDIVVPGIFIALLLRFDHSLNRKRNTYFNASFFAYVLGLSVTIFVMHMFKHAQPALLYLVPACLGIPTLIALINGDISALFKYEDLPKQPENEKTGKEKKNKNQGDSKSNSQAPEVKNASNNVSKKKSQNSVSPKDKKKK
ncbi:minor histocompatibility antigen H13 [Planococcus citri]|uniref:minor histocompatibility antigen H13 n=1 Tax=Planococcus citri TaxID=170843 RepID=UPI0031F7E5D6